MYNTEGRKTWAAELDIYGAVHKVSEGQTVDCPFRYQGQYEDQETGLYYNRFRYYDPEAGSYISQDPIGLLGGNNLYAYVADPLAWIDPLGLDRTCSADKLSRSMRRSNKDLATSQGSMKRAWHKEPGSAAHHIVPGDDPRSAASRAILDKHGVGVDTADNGIFLKHMSRTSKQPGPYHREIHTDEYYRNLNRRVVGADRLGGKDGVLTELENIRSELLFDTFKY